MNIEFHFLNTSGKLTKYKDMILMKGKESFNIIKSFMPIDNVDIVIKSGKGIPGIGIGGYCLGPNALYLNIDTGVENIEEAIDKQILRMLAHELHHCMRSRGPGCGDTLYEAMVSEGLADHFEIEVTDCIPQKWCIALDNDQLKQMEEKAKLLYWNKYCHDKWFYGSEPNEVPNWTGYILGFKIIDNYLKVSNQKASKLFDKSAKEIYDTLNKVSCM
jgi:hypothetical protein